MSLLDKYDLRFDLALEYFLDNLRETNALSSKIIERIKLESGTFFTLLPASADLTKKNQFEQGGILLQYSEEKYADDETKGTYCRIPTIQTEVSHYIYEKIDKKSSQLIFDDVVSYANDSKLPDLFHRFGFEYNNEIYYILNEKECCAKNIEACLEKSNGFWHSLCVITKRSQGDSISNALTDKKLDEICEGSDLLILGAYDGEGYIFWEKSKGIKSAPYLLDRGHS
jgi:hypothetical protein